MKIMKLKPVKSLAELRTKAASDPRYSQLMQKASANLGGPSSSDLDSYRWLEMNANETGDEQGVVDEVNFMLE